MCNMYEERLLGKLPKIKRYRCIFSLQYDTTEKNRMKCKRKPIMLGNNNSNALKIYPIVI